MYSKSFRLALFALLFGRQTPHIGLLCCGFVASFSTKIAQSPPIFPSGKNLLILHSAFCILYSAFCILHFAFCILHFLNRLRFPHLGNSLKSLNSLSSLSSLAPSSIKFPLCKGNKYPVNAENLCAEKSSSLQKQKKSSIFRTVICPILDCCWQRVPPNYLQYKRLDCSYGGFANRSQRRETKIFTNKTHKKQQTNF